MRSSRDTSESRESRHSRDSRSREDRDRERRQPPSSPIIKRVKTTAAHSSATVANKDSPNSATSKTSITNSKQNDKFDAFKATMDAIKAEEVNAINTSAADDVMLFRSTCQEIRNICKEILELRKDDKKNKSEKINSLRIEGSLRFLALKMLNRCDKYRCRDAKEKLQSAKQKVDSFHLQLQNMLYEVMHLQKECKTCQTFRSKDESINLVEVEQFFKEAPQELTAKNVDSHSLHLARLEWELTERKQLEEEVIKAETSKKLAEEEIVVKRETLDKLQPMLKCVVDATQPLYSQLNIPLQANDSIHALAQYLPRPLYVLYVQAISYRHASNASFDVKIIGNVEDVKLFELSANDDEEDDNDEQDEEEQEAPRKTKKSRHRKSVSQSTAPPKITRLKKLVLAHPLSVEISFKFKESTLLCKFSYIVRLEIVTVKVNVNSNDSLNHNIVINESLLSHLLTNGDDGTASPNPSNDYTIKSYGIENFSSLIPEIGFCYKWVQSLAGLDFIASDSKTASNALSISCMEQTIEAIIERFESRLILQQQLCEFDQSIVSLPKQLSKQTRNTINCVIKQFSEVSCEQFETNSKFQEPIRLGIVDLVDSFAYIAKLERGTANLSAAILISIDYPRTPPFFQLSPTVPENQNYCDSSLRELEELINCWCPTNIHNSCFSHILSYQMHNLLIGFDTYLEANQSLSVSSEVTKEFSQKKMFANVGSGRDHSIPYYHDTKRNTFTS